MSAIHQHERSMKWLGLLSRGTKTLIPAPHDPAQDAERRMTSLRDELNLARVRFINSVLSTVGHHLESQELLGCVPYWSSERIGASRAEVLAAIDAALRHAEGTAKIEGLEYPFGEPNLVQALRGVRAMVDGFTLDVPDELVPRQSAVVNARFSQLVSDGMDPLVARKLAETTMGLGTRPISLGQGRTPIVSHPAPPEVLERLTPVASHTPKGHPTRPE